MKKNLFFIIIATLMMYSCGSIKDYNYFQNTNSGDITKIANATQAVKIKPYDKISVLVSSKDPQLAAMFNLLTINTRVGQTTSQISASSNNSYVSYYTVDVDGNIDMPILGKIHVEGLTRQQIAEVVKKELTTAEQGLKEATVTVEFANLHIGVLGEVKSQGIVAIDRDQFTILDAIAYAGDLTQYGNRKNVKIFRKDGDGRLKTYEVDMTNLAELCASPVYMMQQDDVIYVEPNKVKARQSTAAGNTFLTPTFWVSMITLSISVANFLK